MANWNTLKTAVADVINANGNQAITGQLLQNVLNNIITNVGENATFAGIATLATNPGAPDGPVFYLATTAGTYPNFNSIEVLDGEAVILEWNNGTWTKKDAGFATQEAVNEVQSSVSKLNDNVGVLSYPVFDDTEPVEVGAVRRYEGLLYRAKVAGANYWDSEKWERVTLKQLEDEKLSQLGSVHPKAIISASLEMLSDNSISMRSLSILNNKGERLDIPNIKEYTFGETDGSVLVLSGTTIQQRDSLSNLKSYDILLLSYNNNIRAFTGGELLPFINVRTIKNFVICKVVFAPGLTYVGNSITIPTLTVIDFKGNRTNIQVVSTFTLNETNGVVLVLNTENNLVEYRENTSFIKEKDIVLLTYNVNRNTFSSGELLPYINKINSEKDIISVTDPSISVVGNTIYINVLSVIDRTGNRTRILSQKYYEFNEDNGYVLVLDINNNIVFRPTLSDIEKNDTILLSYYSNSNEFMGGMLLPYINTKNIKNSSVIIPDSSVGNNPLGLHTLPTNQGQLNMIKRCRQLTDIEWTPVIDLPKLGVNAIAGTKEYFEDVFKAGVTYKGIPYGRCVNYKPEYGYSDMYVGNTIDLSTFVTSIGNKDSMVCKETLFDIVDHRTLPYAVVCSALTCYALNVDYYPTSQIPTIPGLNYISDVITDGERMDLHVLQLGDVLNKEADHCAVVTDIVINDNIVEYVEICEATSMGNGNRDIKGGQLGGVCRRIAFRVEDFFKEFAKYKVYRYSRIESIPYIKNPYVNIGGELDEKPYLHYSVMPYEGNNFRYKITNNPSVKLLISCKGYGYLRVFKDDVEIEYSPIALSNNDEFKNINVEVGTYRAYLCNMNNNVDIARTDECKFFVVSI